MARDKTDVIVDTNVLAVANHKANQASSMCVLACLDKLEDIINNNILLLDDKRYIIQEYMTYSNFSGQPGAGDRFFKWLWYNQANEQHCRKIPVTPHPERGFAEFPQDPDLESFDRDDRKFVAVAVASESAPAVINASDTDWWNHREALERNGVHVIFLCPELMNAR